MKRITMTKLIAYALLPLTLSFSNAAFAADPLVRAFQKERHVKTLNQTGTRKEFTAEILPVQIKDQDVIRLSHSAKPRTLQMIGVDLARGAGLAPIAWTVALPDGREFNLTGAADAGAIDAKYKADGSQFRDNLFFQSGVVAPLFPQTNRLTGTLSKPNTITAKVSGQTVTMPLNNTANIKNAIPHHLHGLLFGQLAKAPANGEMVRLSGTSAAVVGQFEVGAPWWTGQTSVETTSELTKDGYVFHMKVKNIGKTPVPVGAGAHPYFSSPDLGKDAIRVHVPARELVEINNLSDVLPTGKIMKLTDADPALNFTDKAGTPLYDKAIRGNETGSRLDNLWVDLEKDSNGFAYAEVFFPLSNLKVRMTALTKNVIGIQGYAPNFSADKKPFIALELVTNLPDPREELWGATPTGMALLKPSETFEYGYKVEVMSIK